MEERENVSEMEQLARIRHEMCENYARFGLSEIPSMAGPEGIRFDFCWGLRIMIPESPVRKSYRVQYWDTVTGKLCYNGIVGGASWIISNFHYFRPTAFRITDATSGEVVFEHEEDLRQRAVMAYFPVETVGDVLAWFPAVEEFRKKHDCRMSVCVTDFMRSILEPCYPEIEFVSRKDLRDRCYYAMFLFGVSFDGSLEIQPNDFRTQPLVWHGYDILGLDPREYRNVRPMVSFDKEKREVKEPYVCISSMASGGCKLWLNESGWDGVVAHLKNVGYRVIDIDAQKVVGSGITYHRIPREAEDFTGKGEEKTLADRASMIYHADFFIGLGSGLSWLAWAVGKPVVLISGFSMPWCEFDTPYRIYNPMECHGCFNDVRHEFDAHDCFWCPKYKGTDKHLVCSTSITSHMVISAIKRIPEYCRHVDLMAQAKIEKDMAEKQSVADAPAVHQPSKTVVVDGKPIGDSGIIEVIRKPVKERDEQGRFTGKNGNGNGKKKVVMSFKPGQPGASKVVKNLFKDLYS